MPELPEVETIRRDIHKEFINQRIKQVEVSGSRSIRRQPAEQFVSRAEGRRLLSTSRRGKYLILKLDNREMVVAHMGMSGQLLRASSRDPRGKHTHVVFVFAGGIELRFVDPRTFGELFIASPEQIEGEVPELAHLGFDPVEQPISCTALGTLLGARRAKLKPLLMDQRFVAGIGNMYADEILFAAGLRPDRSADQLTSQEVRRLCRSIVDTLEEAIHHRGSSLADEQYRDLFGVVGAYQKLHKVYDREGQLCPCCRSEIVRVKANGRSSFFCPRCQV